MKYLIVIGVLIIGFIVLNKIAKTKSSETFSNEASTKVNTESNEVDIKELLDVMFPKTSDLVFEEVEALRENPKDYFVNNSEIFKDYYFDKDSLPGYKALSLIVIGHHLSNDSNFALIDWNQSNEDTLYFINSILSRHSLEEIRISTREHISPLKAKYLEYNSEDYMETYEFLNLCGDIVLDYNFSLIELGRGNDAYEFFLIESNSLELLLELSKNNDFSMTLISGKN